MNRTAKRVIPALVLLVLIGGVAAWWFLFRDDAPEKLTLRDDPTTATTSPGSATTGARALDLPGTWKVAPSAGQPAGGETTVAGYRVQERFAGGAAKVTAAGRTPDATGTVTVQGGKVTAATVDVDLTTLSSDKAQRDAAIRNRGIETSKFPKATFQLSRPIALPAVEPGRVFEVRADGKLTMHGVTRDVTIPLKAKDSGTRFIVQGTAAIKMADFQIDPPNIPGFVSVDDNGELEFLLVLAKA